MNYLLIGKPNVGKSSIYNILTASNLNIVHSESGTTRDWHKEIIKDTNSFIFDTPGILINDTNKKNILNFDSDSFIKETIDIFIYVVDFTDGFNESDKFAISRLRKFNKDIILLINKYDNPKADTNEEYFRYGVDNIFYISCSHRHGISNLRSLIEQSIGKVKSIPPHDFSLAIFGKPNAGKSTFLNTLLGYKRSSTSPIAGTTSDNVIDYFNYKNKKIKIIDTAGIGKKSNIKKKSINDYSVKKSFMNIVDVNSAIIIIDSKEGIDRQDKRIIKMILEKSESVILIFNKFDLILNKAEYKNNIISDIKYTFSEINNIKVCFISSFNGGSVLKILDYINNSIFQNNYKISTSALNN